MCVQTRKGKRGKRDSTYHVARQWSPASNMEPLSIIAHFAAKNCLTIRQSRRVTMIVPSMTVVIRIHLVGCTVVSSTH